MSISALFEDLGAPLKNIRWSWGAENKSSGVLFLRVWQDETQKRDGRLLVRLTNRDIFEGTADKGYAERREHIEMLRNGRRGYLIFCEAKKPITVPRELNGFVSDRIFPTGDVIEVDGDIYVQYFLGIKIEEFQRK